MNRKTIVSKIEAGVSKVGKVIEAMPWESPEFYGMWCAQTSKYVTHSAPLIKLCADLLPPGVMKTDMQKHHKEELGHEVFATRDAKHFGLDAKAVVELPETTAIYGKIYELIRKNPTAMFGYGMALENVSRVYGPILAKRACKAYNVVMDKNHTKNVPASFLTLHAEVDQEHAEHGMEALDRIADGDLEFVAEVMDMTFDTYANFLLGIQKTCSKRAA